MTAVEAEPVTVVTEPGIYDDMDEATYHGDPVPGGSLSVSGAKKLLDPSCPAIFDHERRYPKAPTRALNLGTAAHTRVLGTGRPLTVVQGAPKGKPQGDAKDYGNAAAKEHRDAILADDGTPVLRSELEQVDAMAAALRAHPLAVSLLDPEHGLAERSLFAVDPWQQVWKRGRVDWLATPPGQRPGVVDYKTTVSAHPAAIQKTVERYRYHQQDAWYRDLVGDVGLAEGAGFVFIFQEKTAPYVVTVVELDDTAVREGRRLNARALQVYADCTRTGVWPGYTSGVATVSLPPWGLTSPTPDPYDEDES